MSPGVLKVLVILAAGAVGVWMLWSLALLAGAACSIFPLGVCPLPR